ncbi:MAG TPA: cob(I)yrinic acid a,c-diamide adenosyltransferase [Thermoanaerobaculia bacterium]|jgi:cob(I)alamin adenosyltransferase
MPRITKVYTRSGDDGSTSLGSGQRVPKDSLRIEAYGTVDEVNSHLGAALAAGLDPRVAAAVRTIQNELFHLGSDLCILEKDKARMPAPRIEGRHVDALEKLMDALSQELAPLENFVLPGGSPGAAALHVARTVCRRAERLLVTLGRAEPIGPHTVEYANRLSDALFVLARYENHRRGVPDVLWNSRA